VLIVKKEKHCKRYYHYLHEARRLWVL